MKNGMLETDGARRVMIDIVNTDVRLWVNDMMLAAQQSSLEVVPPPSGKVFNTLPLPAFDRTGDVCRGGGSVLKRIVSQAHGKGDGSSMCKAHNSPGGASGVNGRSRAIPPRSGRCIPPLVVVGGIHASFVMPPLRRIHPLQ